MGTYQVIPILRLCSNLYNAGIWFFLCPLHGFQAAALLLFNASDRLSYSDIKTQLNLADDDLVRLLQSLSCAKYKILTKEPNSRTVTPTDYFEFNPKFTDRMRRIRVRSISLSLSFVLLVELFWRILTVLLSIRFLSHLWMKGRGLLKMLTRIDVMLLMPQLCA